MIHLVQIHRDEVAALCRRFRVQRLDLFGSAANDGFDVESSDLDFLVEFQPLAADEHADAYFGLLHSLQKLFGRSVDLVVTKAITNRYFLRSVNETRTVLYAA